MGKKNSALVLGYTRAGHAVQLPSHEAPDMGLFLAWSAHDHFDAARILVEHSERMVEPIDEWCVTWAAAHDRQREATRRSKVVRGAAEAAIRVGSLRRRR